MAPSSLGVGRDCFRDHLATSQLQIAKSRDAQVHHVKWVSTVGAPIAGPESADTDSWLFWLTEWIDSWKDPILPSGLGEGWRKGKGDDRGWGVMGEAHRNSKEQPWPINWTDVPIRHYSRYFFKSLVLPRLCVAPHSFPTKPLEDKVCVIHKHSGYFSHHRWND